MNVEFDQNWTFLEQMQGQRLEAFKNKQSFKVWHLPTHSCMLILVGYNHFSVRSFSQCWLSPVALNMIAELKKPEQAELCVFHVPVQRDSDRYHQILLSIILQLLNLNREAVQDESKYGELYAEIQGYRAAMNQRTVRPEKEDHLDRSYTLLQNVTLRVLGESFSWRQNT